MSQLCGPDADLALRAESTLPSSLVSAPFPTPQNMLMYVV